MEGPRSELNNVFLFIGPFRGPLFRAPLVTSSYVFLTGGVFSFSQTYCVVTIGDVIHDPSLSLYIYIYVYVYVCIHIHVYIYREVYTYIYIYIYIHTSLYMYTYTYEHTYMCIYIYIYV